MKQEKYLKFICIIHYSKECLLKVTELKMTHKAISYFVDIGHMFKISGFQMPENKLA